MCTRVVAFFMILLSSLLCISLNAQVEESHVVRIKVEKKGKYGYLNDRGEEVIPCIYDYLLDFHEGVVAGRKGTHWVYLNIDGEVFLDLADRYTICGDFHDGKAYVSKGERLLSPYVPGLAYTHSKDIRYINRQGDEVLHLDHNALGYFMEYPNSLYFSEGLLKVTIPYLPNSGSTLHGYVDISGKWRIPPRFRTQGSFEEHFSEGLAVVGLHPYSQMKTIPRQRYGFINKQGRWMIMPDFHKASSFFHGASLVTIFSKRADGSDTWEHFYINKQGKRMFPDSIQASPMSRDIYHNTSLCVIVKNEKGTNQYALADTLLNMLTSFDWKHISEGDLWACKKDSLYGFINDRGEMVIAPQYRSVSGFRYGLCIVYGVDENGKNTSGIINMKNEWVMPMQDYYDFKVENGLILRFTQGSRYRPTYFNREGNRVDLKGYLFSWDDIQWVEID